MRTHYPRTPHLPWSPGVASDDVRARRDLPGLFGREVVVTEKLDGENTTLYPDGLHARSLDSAHHPSRAWVKALQSRIGRSIPPGRRICGENLYARHSIGYRELESWFYGFSVWDGEQCLDWDRTVRFTRRLGIPVPPVLWRGTFDERALRALRLDTARQEGFVVRTVEGFERAEFAERVAKWVRPRHVQTDEHWMLAPVVVNGLGPAAALWAVRSGEPADPSSLLLATGMVDAESVDVESVDAESVDVEPDEAVVAEATERLDLLGRTGDARLAGVLAALLHRSPRARLAPRLAPALGPRLARRTADLVGLYERLHHPCPDQERRTGLARFAVAADLGVLHALAAAALAGRTDAAAAEAREQVDWSALHAEEAGLLAEAPLAELRTELRRALDGLEPDAADRCWAEAREAFALGRITGAAEAVALTWRRRAGAFPRLVHLMGPSGSGKSTFAAGLPGIAQRVSLDELREARGSRSDQRSNAAVLHEGLDRLDAALARGGTVVWDATSLNRQQRSLVRAVADRREALVTHVVLQVDPAELARRNRVRAHPVPAEVLDAQLARFAPPYPGQAHRTWYVGSTGTVEDVAGTLDGEDD